MGRVQVRDCSDAAATRAPTNDSARTIAFRLFMASTPSEPSVSEGALHFRSGSSGQWETYFDDDDVAYYRELAAKYDVGIYP